MKSNIYLLTLTLPLFVGCSKAEPKQPNILYIMSDDHTSTAIGAYGSRLSSLNPTPTIDRLAREGVLMENAFCTNAISTPSRACIISGQYSNINKVYDLDCALPVENQHLPQEMRKLGYETAIVGKWHLKNQPESFDYYKVFYGQGSYFDPVLIEKGATDSLFMSFGGEKGMMPGKIHKGHSSDVITDVTLNWLENQRDKDKPFFLCHQFKAPHDYFEFNPRYKDYLEDTNILEPASLWNNGNHGSEAIRGYQDTLQHIIGSSVGKRSIVRNMGMHMEIDPNLPDDEYKRQAYQEYLKRYLRCVKGVDDNIKRIFDYLEANDLMDNTIIIYTADQGFFLGEHDYIDKRWMYEEAMRMPLLIRYPKSIKGGSRCDAIVNNVDFAATIIDMAGGNQPEYMQGDSFKDILYSGEEPESWKKATYYRYWMHLAHRHNNPAHFGIRTKDFKLIFFYGLDYTTRAPKHKYPKIQTPAGWELYNMKEDPLEMNNCYNDPQYKDVIKDLKAQLKTLREKYGEDDSKFPEIERVINENWD